MTRAAAKYPEEIAAREDSLYAKSEAKPAKSRAKGIHRSARKTTRLRERVRNAKKLSDDGVLDALVAIRSGNHSLRSEAKRLGVSHVALLKRVKNVEKLLGYHPDELDKAIIRSALATGVPGMLRRLSDIIGRTQAELLEAVR